MCESVSNEGLLWIVTNYSLLILRDAAHLGSGPLLVGMLDFNAVFLAAALCDRDVPDL